MPMIEPASVIWLVVPARAMPKSATLTRPSWSTITLCGLMSRWMIPLRCAKRSAARIWRAYEIATGTGQGPRATSSSFSVRPSTYSMTMKYEPLTEPRS